MWALSVTLIMLASPAFAIDQASKDCDQAADRDRSIAGCSQLLARGARLSAKNRAAAYNNRGNAYVVKGELDRALADYDAAIILDPESSLAYNGRGNVYLRKREFDRALADFNAAILLNPQYSSAYNGRGEVYFYKSDYDRALADYNEAIHFDSRNAAAFANRAEVYARKGAYESAITDAELATRLDPKLSGPHAYLAYVYAKMGDLGRAQKEIDDAFRLDSKSADAFLYRGEIYLLRKEPQLALQDFEDALALYPYSVLVSAGRDAARLALRAPITQPSAAVAAAPVAQATSERRIALIIANSRYAAQAPLRNPANDAAAIAAALRSAGFQEVNVANDLSRDALVKALHNFQDRAERSDWALIYFSGHGLEVGGTTYIVPTDAHLRTDRDIQDEAVTVNRLMEYVNSARKLKIVIVDACRDNPFNNAMQRTAASRDLTKGLGPVEPLAATLVVYAAKNGQLAQDGDGVNSPFAVALVRRLAEPHVEVSKLFRLVTDDDLDVTRQTQQPFVYGSLPGREDFYFRP
jgi:tetratricopeptide (TPR) repeat protein